MLLEPTRSMMLPIQESWPLANSHESLSHGSLITPSPLHSL